ncbi:putative membrane protein [Bosea sp. CRIB-10]|jgi:putative membrane protein|uniref:DUF4142 domain-containing protein n=1 Tax=Bosea sp. CRIB-10 TaxID=378404 RepID=UPI0008EF7FE5|nr:DUF4142 domain-containing protein [Bosea sp. CRIB-10]SFD31156.1 putative membrane protein [Bosea sp. CRIB-10]
MKLALALAVLMSVALPAYAQSLGEKTGVNAIVGRSPSTMDFVTELALSDMFETKSSELAAVRGDQKARDFAATMIEDHQKSSSELSLIVKPHIDKTPLPSKLDKGHQARIDKLKKLDGAEFTKAYFKEQVAAHEAAVSLLERYRKSGSDADLKAFAEKLLPGIRHHLEMAKSSVS